MNWIYWLLETYLIDAVLLSVFLLLIRALIENSSF